MKKAALLSILIAVVLLGVGVIAAAQQTRKVARIGVLFGGTASSVSSANLEARSPQN